MDKKVQIMGILNTTPDSFSDGGSFLDKEKATKQAKKLLADGAHIIDIGGESTGPGAEKVNLEEELSRTIPVIESLARICTVSIDTYKSSVADKALCLGAKIVNDVTALRADPEMKHVVANHKAKVVLMYSKQDASTPHASKEARNYQDVILEISEFLDQQVSQALAAGVSENNIILDPGMGGFVSPDPKYSWEILERLEELSERFKNFEILIGTSRKGFLGGDISKRDPISALTALSAATKGANIIRTHNAQLTKEFLEKGSKLF